MIYNIDVQISLPQASQGEQLVLVLFIGASILSPVSLVLRFVIGTAGLGQA